MNSSDEATVVAVTGGILLLLLVIFRFVGILFGVWLVANNMQLIMGGEGQFVNIFGAVGGAFLLLLATAGR